MGMREYPMCEPAAFLLYGEAAKLIWDQVFTGEEYDADDRDELAQQFEDGIYSHSFCGNAETLFPELTKAPLDLTYDDVLLAAIPCDKVPNLFSAAYPDKEALRKEFEDKLAKQGVTIPDDLDWWRYIVKINGTDFS